MELSREFINDRSEIFAENRKKNPEKKKKKTSRLTGELKWY